MHLPKVQLQRAAVRTGSSTLPMCTDWMAHCNIPWTTDPWSVVRAYAACPEKPLETTVGGSPGYVNPRRPLSLCDACGAIQSSQGLNETKAATSGEDKVVKVSSLLSSTAVSIFMIPVGRSGNCHQASSCTRLQQTRRCGLACRL